MFFSVFRIEKMQEEIEDLEDALALERAQRKATGFKRWKDFIKELEMARKLFRKPSKASRTNRGHRV